MGNQGFAPSQGGGAQGQNGAATGPQGGSGTGTQGASGTGVQGTQNGAQGDAGSTVSRADYDALVQRFDLLERDNKRYRDERRKQNRNGAAGATAQASGVGRASANDDGSGTDDDGSDVSAQVATLRTQLQTANFRTDITTAAVDAGCLIPGDLWRLIDRDSPDVDVDELGYVKNAAAVVAEMKKTRPALFNDGASNRRNSGGGNINGGAGTGGNQHTQTQDMNAGIRSALRR